MRLPSARLKLVRQQAIDVDLSGRRAELGLVGYQRAQSFAEGRAFVMCVTVKRSHENTKTRKRILWVFSCLRLFVVALLFKLRLPLIVPQTSRERR